MNERMGGPNMRKVVFFDTQTGDKRYYTRAFKNVYTIEIVYTSEPLTEVTARRYNDAAVASVSVTSDVNENAIAKMPDLEYIASRSTGVNHINIPATAYHDVLVSTVSTHVEATVAEHTIMLLLALARRLPEAMQQIQERVVDHAEITGLEVAGKTMGIIGCGRIGRRVARIAASLGMNVIGYDPQPEEDECISYVERSELLATSDVISLHSPLNDETHHLIDTGALAEMKSGALLLNTASGGLIDTRALIDALFSGRIAGAGLDVLEGEQLLRLDEEISLLHPEVRKQDLLLHAEHEALLRIPSVIITPHNGFNSHDALERIRQETAENIKQYLKHEPQNLVKVK